MDVGIRAINALLTVGRGQRLGLFAGTGVGKSVLLGMMARYTRADVIVVGLIGERGREVKEFIEDILEEEGLRRSVVVAAPADAPPLVRLQGAAYATAIAEHFRDHGRHVLLLMDSLTRFAHGAARNRTGHRRTTGHQGLPALLLRQAADAGGAQRQCQAGGGSITAFYTVLSEGDDQQDPIADAARGILDGHFVLSRELAEAGHYPAIDVEQSISRAMNQLITPRAARTGAPVQTALFALPARPRPDRRRRVFGRIGPSARQVHRAVPETRGLPPATHRRARRQCHTRQRLRELLAP
jgi:flagellum-specific ATP synthase